MVRLRRAISVDIQARPISFSTEIATDQGTSLALRKKTLSLEGRSLIKYAVGCRLSEHTDDHVEVDRVGHSSLSVKRSLINFCDGRTSHVHIQFNKNASKRSTSVQKSRTPRNDCSDELAVYVHATTHRPAEMAKTPKFLNAFPDVNINAMWSSP